jgi:uncharacterized circularly permuted ATP-grasp superfamily protein/uncharacterized alpha-E superfamily protein
MGHDRRMPGSSPLTDVGADREAPGESATSSPASLTAASPSPSPSQSQSQSQSHALPLPVPPSAPVPDAAPGHQASLLPDETPDAAALALAAGLRGTPGCFDELHGHLTEPGQPTGELAGYWRAFFDASGPDGWMDIAQTKARIDRRVQDDGVTYNVYADGTTGVRAWPLEPLPFIVAADDWAAIETGVAQRARLLDAVMADIYGDRALLDEGLLPASLVLAHPQYLRALHGARPAGGVHLHVAAFDLARGHDGHWWVVGQRTQAPSGLGYLLENRLIIAQQFPEAFRELHVQRVGASFQALVQGLAKLSPAGERSRIVLLTPGPHNETYFEHAFLARYLGIALVEGGDLTVRGERVYLKTLHGLEPVHVVLRRVDDEWLDPLELKPDSALGVPGLLSAIRAGQVVVANAPGAGFLESPGLAAFWPAIARRLLGEDLLLPATTTWWCGEDAVWQAQRADLSDFVVAPTFPTSGSTRSFDPVAASDLSPEALAALRARIDARGAAHTLQARVKPSEMPVWREGALEPRAAIVRVFAITDGRGGWRVMPGGLTRIATRRDSTHDAWLSMQHGSASVDTWVLTKGAVDATSLLPKPLAPGDLAGARRTVTSRAAENLFWLGRYTERAENCVRLARITLEALPNATEPVLAALGRLASRHGLVGPKVPSPLASLRVFERSLVHALADASKGSSVAFDLAALRGCAQALRERLSQEHWRLIDELCTRYEDELKGVIGDGHAIESSADVLAVLAHTATQLSAITGAQLDRMTRDDGWRLLSAGRQIERLDFLTDVLATGFEHGLSTREDGFTLLLGLFDSTITYRAHFQARREVPPLVYLLAQDTENPRAIAWVAASLRDRVERLVQEEPAWCQRVLKDFPDPAAWSLEVLCGVDAQGRRPGVVSQMRDLGARTRQLSAELGRRVFAHVGPVDRTVWQ